MKSSDATVRKFRVIDIFFPLLKVIIIHVGLIDMTLSLGIVLVGYIPDTCIN